MYKVERIWKEAVAPNRDTIPVFAGGAEENHYKPQTV
jgi:hypothetical protein